MHSHNKEKKDLDDKQNIREIEPDEIQLWNDVIKTITPSKQTEKRNPTHHLTKNRKLVDIKLTKQEIVSSAEITPAQFVPNELNHGKAPGLDRKSKNRMRRGQMCLEGELDLHGMTQSKAKRALISFIEKEFFMGHREALIITGKGMNRDGKIGVLRQLVPVWLNEQPTRSLILGFNYAARKHGGEGALYVLIRKNR